MIKKLLFISLIIFSNLSYGESKSIQSEIDRLKSSIEKTPIRNSDNKNQFISLPKNTTDKTILESRERAQIISLVYNIIVIL